MTAELAKRIAAGTRADDLVLDASVTRQIKESVWGARLDRIPVLRHVKKVATIKGYVERYGVRSSLRQAYFTARHLANKRSGERQYVFLSHPLDQTGGPLVLIEMIEEFSQRVKSAKIRLVAAHIDSQHLAKLRRLGVKLDGMDPRLGIGALAPRLSLKPNDFVLMNTSAIAANYRNGIFQLLSAGRLKHAFWYVHEDDPQVQFKSKQLRDKIRRLLNQKKLTMCVPSIKMQEKYEKFFNAPIAIIPLHVDVDEKLKKPRLEADYEKMRFVISGIATGGRKGQTTALFGFYKFLTDHYQGNETKYRDFKLRMIGLGDDYLSVQLKAIGKEVLGSRFEYSATIGRQEALESMSECNAVICCSLMEAFGLYVAEGMYMGHVVLRNDCSGVDEQLKPGVNGYELKDGDLGQFTDVIERVLNKSKTTNRKLQQMGFASQEMIKDYASNNYYQKLMDLDK